MKKSKQFYILTIAIATMVLINAGLFLWSQYVKTSALEQANRQTATQLNLISYDMVESAFKTHGKIPEKYIDIIPSNYFHRLSGSDSNHLIGNSTWDIKFNCEDTVINGTTAKTVMWYYIDTKVLEPSAKFTHRESESYDINWEIKNNKWVVSSVKHIIEY